MTREILRQELAPIVGKRIRHILSTEEECLRLAALFSLSEEETEKLATAALLHDITKHFSREEHLAYLAEQGIAVGEDFLCAEKTLHALTGAYYPRERYPELVDYTVFGTILYPTTGCADMTLSQKLLYLADYIEPNRTFPDCVTLRQYFYDRIERGSRRQVLHDTLVLSFDMTVSDLLKQRCPIHSDTVAAWNFLTSKGAEA
jgi:nicotinate-nucleotide adenylyltransferase